MNSFENDKKLYLSNIIDISFDEYLEFATVYSLEDTKTTNI